MIALQNNGIMCKRPADTVLIYPIKPLAPAESFVRISISDMTEEEAAPGFSVEKFLVLLSWEGEIAVNFTALEAQVKYPPRRGVEHAGQKLGIERLPIQ